MEFCKLIPLLFILVGCQTVPVLPKEVKIPVWTPPTIEMPQRPIMKSSEGTLNDSPGLVVRRTEDDLNSMTSYALQLENILKKIKDYKP